MQLRYNGDTNISDWCQHEVMLNLIFHQSVKTQTRKVFVLWGQIIKTVKDLIYQPVVHQSDLLVFRCVQTKLESLLPHFVHRWKCVFVPGCVSVFASSHSWREIHWFRIVQIFHTEMETLETEPAEALTCSMLKVCRFKASYVVETAGRHWYCSFIEKWNVLTNMTSETGSGCTN